MKRMWSKNELKDQADARVKALVEGGTLENAKPIYCHPITIQCNGETIKCRLTCLIFNNDSTPFTLDSFKAYVDALYASVSDTIRIMMSGAYNVVGTKIIIASHFSRGAPDSSYSINGLKETSGSLDNYNNVFNVVFPEGTTLTDGVNKIN